MPESGVRLRRSGERRDAEKHGVHFAAPAPAGRLLGVARNAVQVPVGRQPGPGRITQHRGHVVPWDAVIDETQRVQSPLAHLPLRYAVEEIELDGVTIPKGDPILVNYSAIGRDPQVHGDTADVFDITRENNGHLSFGHGAHFCLGSGIARAVATIGLATLFERFPNLSLAVKPEELQPLPTFIMNGHRSQPVRLR